MLLQLVSDIPEGSLQCPPQGGPGGPIVDDVIRLLFPAGGGPHVAVPAFQIRGTQSPASDPSGPEIGRGRHEQGDVAEGVQSRFHEERGVQSDRFSGLPKGPVAFSDGPQHRRMDLLQKPFHRGVVRKDGPAQRGPVDFSFPEDSGSEDPGQGTPHGGTVELVMDDKIGVDDLRSPFPKER